MLEDEHTKYNVPAKTFWHCHNCLFIVWSYTLGGILGIPFIAFAPFVGVAIGVYLFGKVSMAHFNPAVSLGFLITRHINNRQFLYYLGAEITGALLASLFVKYLVGNNASLGANFPNYNFPITVIIGVEVLASYLFNDCHTNCSLH